MKALRAILICFCFLMASLTSAQDVSEIEVLADSLFQIGLNDKMIPGGAISVVSNNRILFAKGYGYSDWNNKIPVSGKKTLFQMGSIGKILTAMSVLRLAEQGRLDMDNDIRDYWDDFSLDENFQSLINLKQLLTHSAGFDDRVIGYAVKTKEEIKPLKRHLEERMPRRFQEAGSSISYSNYSYALAGLIVENIPGMSFTAFVERNFLSRLGMENSTYDLPDDDLKPSGYATGYLIGKGEFVEQPPFYTHTKPAGGLHSSASEMTRLMMMLLNEGVFQGNQLLQKESIEMMFRRQFSNHPELPGYSLGFEEQLFNGYPAVAKGGGTLGFVSAMLLFPDHSLGVFITTNVASDDFIEMFMRQLAPRLFKSDENPSSSTSVNVDIKLNRFTGTYRSNRYNHHTIEDFVALFLESITVRSTDNGMLTFYHGGASQEYVAIKSLIFQNTNDGSDLLIFDENEHGQVVNLYRNGTFAGLSVPLSYEKVPWFSSPHFVNELLSWVAFILMTSILIPLVWLVIFLIRLAKKDFWQKQSWPKPAQLSAFFLGILSVVHLFGYVAQTNRLGLALVFGVPTALLRLNYIPFIIIILFLILTYHTYKIWLLRSAAILARIYYAVFSVSALTYLLVLYRWHFIGFHI